MHSLDVWSCALAQMGFICLEDKIWITFTMAYLKVSLLERSKSDPAFAYLLWCYWAKAAIIQTHDRATAVEQYPVI